MIPLIAKSQTIIIDSTLNDFKNPLNVLNNKDSINYFSNTLIFYEVSNEKTELLDCNIKKHNDTLNIEILKKTFGSDIILEFKIVNETFTPILTHFNGNLNIYNTLKINQAELKLSSNNFKKGKILTGNLDLNFSGKIINEEIEMNNKNNILEKKEIQGHIYGKFKALIK